jgi:hypothetical protein
MKAKIKEYLDAVFADAEHRASDPSRMRELKEEMLGDLYDKYDHMIENGKTPSAAYNAVVAGVGDITPLLDSVAGASVASDGTETPPHSKERGLTPEEEAARRKKRERGALLTSIAVAMYILCWVPLAVLSEVLGDRGGTMIGLPVMFLMIAGATAMIIYRNMTKVTSSAVKREDGDESDHGDDDDDDDDDDNDDDDDCGRSPEYKAVSGILWALTLVAYFLISRYTGAWHVTWLIFLMAVALDNVVKAIFDLRR